MPEKILDLTQAAERIGIKKPSVLEAVERGRLQRRADKNFDVAAVDAFIAGRGHVRGGARRPRTAVSSGAMPDQPKERTRLIVEDALPGSTAHGVPAVALEASTMIEVGAVDLALIALRYVAMPIARAMVGAWVDLQRAGYVGTPASQTEPLCETDGWVPPPGGGEWRDHPLFKAQVMPEHDWAEVAAEAAAWRAQHGIAAP